MHFCNQGGKIMSDVKEIKKRAEIAKEKAEISEKMVSKKRELKRQEELLSKDITSVDHRIKVKKTAKELESLSRDWSKLNAHQV